MATIYIDNDHCLRLKGLKDQDGVDVDSATVIANLTDKGFNDITDPIWPITMNSDGNGDYSAPLPHTFTQTLNKKYNVRLRANMSGTWGEWFEPLSVERRNL